MKSSPPPFLFRASAGITDVVARIETELVIDAGRARISLGGALDTSNAHRLGALLRRLIHEGCTEIDIDLDAVRSLDPSAVGILRGTAKALQRTAQGALRFSGPSPAVADVLARSGLLAPTPDDADTIDLTDEPVPALPSSYRRLELPPAPPDTTTADDRASGPPVRSGGWRERRAPTRPRQ